MPVKSQSYKQALPKIATLVLLYEIISAQAGPFLTTFIEKKDSSTWLMVPVNSPMTLSPCSLSVLSSEQPCEWQFLPHG